MTDPFIEIPQQLEAGKKTVLARIIRQSGSAPRSVGTRCLVLEDGTLMGTIGGGLLEHRVHEGAKDVLRDGKSCIVHFELSGTDVAKTDMLCGGKVDVFLDPVFPDQPGTRAIFERVRDLIQAGEAGTLVTRISGEVPGATGPHRALIGEQGVLGGDASWIEGSSWGKVRELFALRTPQLLESQETGTGLFLEPLRPEDIVILFGAGHVSTFVAPLARMVGFRVVVIDDREEFANGERFPHADEILVLPFSDAFQRISASGSSYLVIVTRGHIHDTTVLRSAIQRDVAYIGMIGSLRKRNVVYGALMEEGVTKENLGRVHSPIGLDIGAETPEEIAISIVAELIQVRARRQTERNP